MRSLTLAVAPILQVHALGRVMLPIASITTTPITDNATFHIASTINSTSSWLIRDLHSRRQWSN